MERINSVPQRTFILFNNTIAIVIFCIILILNLAVDYIQIKWWDLVKLLQLFADIKQQQYNNNNNNNNWLMK